MLRQLIRRLHYLLNRRRLDDELAAEMEFHREMAAAHGGIPVGDLLRLREDSREAWGWMWVDHLGQDLKLGSRLLTRYPGLTLISTCAISVAIALGAIYFGVVDKFQNPRLPIPDGERVVSLRIWDQNSVDEDRRSLFDFAIWRQQVKTIENMGAEVSFNRNLATEDGRVEPVRGAEITANAFRLMSTLPLLGRTLVDRDENPAEPEVVVIGHSLWTSRFDRDPGVVGREVKLGTVSATIVGVMPEGFAFPANAHLWAPLRLNVATLAPRSGPPASIFGRLAPGASIDDARAELGVVGARLSAGDPATHQHLRPHVSAYAKPLNVGEMLMVRNIMYAVNSVFMLLLAIMCTNVATLVFARAATRSWEITVRSALGASRGRIIGQLFGEALVLASVGAAFGLMLAKVGTSYGLAMINATGGALPFWIDASLSWRTILYTAGLTLFGAAIVGIVPALRVTRLNIQDSLRSEAGGRASLRFGGFWTAVIIIQVAITVAFIPLAAGGIFESNRFNQRAEGIGASNYLMAGVGMDREDSLLDPASHAARTRRSLEELERRLGAEPGVLGVAFSDRLPVEDQFKYSIEVDPAGGAPLTGIRTSTMVNVSKGFFDAYGTTVVAGRDFGPVDFESDKSHAMIVNQAFARHVLGGRNAIGQRIRIKSGEIDAYAGDTWYEIVGVVKNFGWQLPQPWEQSAMYRPTLPVLGNASQVAVRVADPSGFSNRLRKLAYEVDPLIRLTDVQPLAKADKGEAQWNWVLTSVAWVVGFIVLALSATGIHALMSFTVSRRTREIGIRIALGAHPRRIITGVFRAAFLQIGAGVLIGSALAALGGLGSTREVLLLLAADGIMLLAGTAACALPIRRALSIDPTEALRAEG
ncbi:MAG: ABC transporter permease [Vicinamibacteria bacterium]|nr:ABC transporter permease [Vicinamibacteria bacterium]